jgi:hypothetical protein
LARRSRTLLRKRIWLRRLADRDGNQSTIHSDLSITKTSGKGKVKPYGSLDGSITFRDCTESMSFDFYASKKEKYAHGHLATLYRLRRVISEFIAAYEKGTKELRDDGYWQ